MAKRILVADDETSVREAVGYALQQEGFEVTLAQDGEDADAKLADGDNFDLLILDIMMPGMDGYTAMREIRKIPSFQDLPVVALTAKAMPGDRENSLSAGASDYVTKPVDVAQLLRIFRGWWS